MTCNLGKLDIQQESLPGLWASLPAGSAFPVACASLRGGRGRRLIEILLRLYRAGPGRVALMAYRAFKHAALGGAGDEGASFPGPGVVRGMPTGVNSRWPSCDAGIWETGVLGCR